MFSSVAIVGVGLVGGSLGMGLLQRRLAAEVIGIDVSPAALDSALRLTAITRGSDSLAAASEAELVVLAASVPMFEAIAAGLGPHLQPGTLVTDVGSVKGVVERILDPLIPTHCGLLPGHPVAGGTGVGVSAASPALFAGRPWVFCPMGRETPRDRERLLGLAGALGAVPEVMTAEEHDTCVARTSHAPHAIAAALAAAAAEADLDQRRSVVGAGFTSTCRVAGGSEYLWRDICLANAGELDEALGSVEVRIAMLRRALSFGDAEGVLEFFAEGRTAYEKLTAPREGPDA